MKSWLALVVVVIALAGARLARSAAVAERGELEIIDEPYTPSQEAAPFLSLGYRELMADLLYVRLRGYYGGYYDTTSAGVAALGEAIVALDPKFEKAYDFAANAMTITPRGVDQASFRRAVALLERGVVEFPRNWQIPLLAGQMYIQDLKSNDPAQ
ncbi:MAG TPA: hypothetical protein VK427_03805, partial [Kofleriaceae bacterium]|nr:hypothetical protein [Kofleriaceae bacterium]